MCSSRTVGMSRFLHRKQAKQITAGTLGRCKEQRETVFDSASARRQEAHIIMSDVRRVPVVASETTTTRLDTRYDARARDPHPRPGLSDNATLAGPRFLDRRLPTLRSPHAAPCQFNQSLHSHLATFVLGPNRCRFHPCCRALTIWTPFILHYYQRTTVVGTM
jgi:hypothetical protein